MFDDIENLLDDAINAHKAKDFNSAAIKYTKILEQDAHHADANHNFGLLTVELGLNDEALIFLQTAINRNPNVTQYWVTFVDTLTNAERFDDARSVLKQAQLFGYTDEVFDHLRHNLDLKQNQSEAQIIVNQIDDANVGFAQIEKSSSEENSLNNLDRVASESFEPKDEVSQAEALPQGHIKSLMKLFNQQKFNQVYEETQELAIQYSNSLILWNLMGVAAAELGRLDQAVTAFQKAISINPNSPDIYNNLGNVLNDKGKSKEAIEAYKKALNLKPDYADAHYNMGNALQDQEKLEEAVCFYKKALTLKPDYAEAYYNLGNALKGVNFKEPCLDLQNWIVSLIERRTYVRPKDISIAALSLLKCEANLQKQLKLVQSDKKKLNLDHVITELNKLPLLLKIMSVCPLPDLELERLFRHLRAGILANISILKEVSPEFLKFQSALALQCFTNEFIYSRTDDEEEAFRALEKIVQNTLMNNNQPSPQMVLALASYKALHEFDWCRLLTPTPYLKEVFYRQVEQPQDQARIKLRLSKLEEVTDYVSSKVREQYEESPYPKWVNLQFPFRPESISKVTDKTNLRLASSLIENVEAPNILIAGCGTGQHSIETSQRFRGSKVLAIDLSLSSLAYAKQKTNELGINNIEYMQADILDLGKLNKQFDIVESVGVLHHMDNPFEGWKVLTKCLKPGGLMKIGLYSELARQAVAKIRAEISKSDIGSSDTEMKSFRDMLITSDLSHHKRIVHFTSDFYSLSELRDLLFHVQEHRFTIAQIKDYLDDLELQFCGFESPKIVAHFKKYNTNQNDSFDLDKWQAYEEANPNAFAGMYQFWCQKSILLG